MLWLRVQVSLVVEHALLLAPLVAQESPSLCLSIVSNSLDLIASPLLPLCPGLEIPGFNLRVNATGSQLAQSFVEQISRCSIQLDHSADSFRHILQLANPIALVAVGLGLAPLARSLAPKFLSQVNRHSSKIALRLV